MPDMEKVIKGLEEAYQIYLVVEGRGILVDSNENEYALIAPVLMRDALALLKAQEPVKPKWEKGYAYCGQCGYKLHWIVERNNFCPNCGKAVKWDG